MSFSAINLERLPKPPIIVQPDFETLLTGRKARQIELAQQTGDLDYAAGVAEALELESEPLLIELQEDSYREVVLRQEVNDAGLGNMLAFAQGASLDHIAVPFGVARQIIQEADATQSPPLPEIAESDERLRRRIQLAPEGYTTAGSEGAYIFWGLAASPLVKDIGVESPTPGVVMLTVLSSETDGTPDQALIDAVDTTTQPRRPLTDFVQVIPAAITPYEVHAILTLFPGPDGEVVREAAEDGLRLYIAARHSLGHDITIAGLHAALWREGVHNIDLGDFDTDLIISGSQAAWCFDWSVSIGGRDV